MRLLYKDGFGAIGGVRLKIRTLFIAFLNEGSPASPTMDETWKRETKGT